MPLLLLVVEIDKITLSNDLRKSEQSIAYPVILICDTATTTVVKSSAGMLHTLLLYFSLIVYRIARSVRERKNCQNGGPPYAPDSQRGNI